MGGSGGSHITVNTDAVRALGSEIVQAVDPSLGKAHDKLQDTRSVLHSNFTSVTPALAIAHAAAVEYMDPELKSKRSHLDSVNARLGAVASNWAESDQKSTVQSELRHHGR